MPHRERSVEFMDHALLRMHQRDVLESEVVALVRSHRARRTIGRGRRVEVRGRIKSGKVLIVYERHAELDLVVTVMWE